ncbi:hypothetical protein R5W23_001969 [Gemmata sp. JC673]|uniref:TIR domain-containing protein n=1 Tax=Gemmata algarum TaxID=2975278 RepID=A0ABU5F0P3_9BACT|nr:hypothetical protein [Gemmata algarum]MDY3560723.1 hypothetical protein [Gemmata algarum]
MQLAEHDLRSWSQITVRFFTSRDWEPGFFEPLVIKYAGTYRWGSEGWPDATYMQAMAKAGMTALNACCVIYDATELSYRWGNNINQAFPNVDIEPPPVPVAIVIGPGCEPGMPHLWSLLATNEYVDRGETVYFRRLEAAWKFVEGRLAETDS